MTSTPTSGRIAIRSRIAPPDHRLVIDEAIVRKPRQRRKPRLSPAVLDAGNVSGIISAMASGNAICYRVAGLEAQR